MEVCSIIANFTMIFQGLATTRGRGGTSNTLYLSVDHSAAGLFLLWWAASRFSGSTPHSLTPQHCRLYLALYWLTVPRQSLPFAVGRQCFGPRIQFNQNIRAWENAGVLVSIKEHCRCLSIVRLTRLVCGLLTIKLSVPRMGGCIALCCLTLQESKSGSFAE